MADEPISDRRFTDREVRAILKEAVKRAPTTALARREGLTLAELKGIGLEVGIDPDRLEDAARSVTGKGGVRPNRLIGAPTRLNVERRVERGFDPEATPRFLSLIRRTMGQQGEVAELRGSLEWSTKGEIGERLVTLSTKDETTTIQGVANLTNAAVLTYLPAGIFGLIGTLVGITQAAEADSVVGLVIAAAVLPTLYMLLRTILRKISASEMLKLEKVVDDLVRLAEESDG